jgi:hypothetical protein
VFYNKFAAALASLNTGLVIGNAGPHSTQSLQGIHSLPPAAQTALREKAAKAIMWSFVSVLPLMGLSVLAALMLGNVWINPKKKKEQQDSSGAVIYSSYLIALGSVSLHLTLVCNGMC